MRIVSCRKCHSRVSDQYSFCPHCLTPMDAKEGEAKKERKSAATIPTSKNSNEIPNRSVETAERERARSPEKQFCVNCSVEVISGSEFCGSCGQPLTINIKDVLNSTFKIIKKAPTIILPICIEPFVSSLLSWWLILAPLSSLSTASFRLSSLQTLLVPLLILISLGLVESPLVRGMYPSMVKKAMDGKRIDMPRAFRRAVRKFPPSFVSNILVSIAVLVGSLLLVVPGVIVTTWYYYTCPAIILEDRDARGGMSASYSFARNRKWKTFLMLLITFMLTGVGSLLTRTTSFFAPNLSPTFPAISMIVGSVAGVLHAVMSSYVYLTYAMPKKHSAQ